MRLLDLILALCLLTLTCPLLLVVALAILIDSGPPLMYRSRRIGKDGREFSHFKFRTMTPGPEIGRVFFEHARITHVGRVLRALHLDELPELGLVLSGQMSLVGPRPLPASLLENLAWRPRARVRPGLTCLAQLSLLRHGRLDKRLQLKLDNIYITRRSLRYDLRLILATLAALHTGEKADLDPAGSADRKAFAARQA
ncbi:MAG TPA: sugar transferase [Spirochaetia bacterium]|nr:sugar transferase [Spirochaetia bacterium]